MACLMVILERVEAGSDARGDISVSTYMHSKTLNKSEVSEPGFL